MKKIFFIRHAESEGNAKNIAQSNNTKITRKGSRQAKKISRYFKKNEIDVIVSSDMVRALETANIISKNLKKDIIPFSLFIEKEKLASENVIGLKDKMHYSTEQFNELKERARECLKLLSTMPQEKILVVTHGYFLRVIIAFSIMGESLTYEEFRRFIYKFSVDNVSITTICYNDKFPNSPWWIETVNSSI